MKNNLPDGTGRMNLRTARSCARFFFAGAGANKIALLNFLILICLPVCVQVEANGKKQAAGLRASSQNPGQDKGGAPAHEPEALTPGLLSPYLIEWYLDISEDADLKKIWRLLKMEVSGDRPHRCDGDCTTETFDIKAGSEAEGRTAALKISFEKGGFYQYLIFRQARSLSGAKEEWKFLGNIDSRGQSAGPPGQRVETGSDRTWFVIRELWARESGMRARGDVWYEIKEGEVKQVLSYPVEGEYKPCDNHPGRSYKTMLLRHGLEDGIYTVPIQLLVSYNVSDCSRGDDPPALFAKGQKARYVWNEDKERFALDASPSGITEKELGSVYGVEKLSDEKFLEYNFEELSVIAKNGNSTQQEWLRKFLTGMPDGSRKAALQEKLRP